MKNMFTNHYILDEQGNPVLADLDTWAAWIQKAERHVGDEKVGPYRISTVFLGLDHQYGEGPPVLWETMIFRSPADDEDDLDQHQERCSGSKEQAEAMHHKVVELVKEKYKP
jgi:hypothetical protein